MAFSIYKHRQRGSKLYEITNIKEIIELGQFQLAMKKIHEFIDNYGNDIEILYLYGKLLRKTGYVEESINRRESMFQNHFKEIEIIEGKEITCSYVNKSILADGEAVGMIIIFSTDQKMLDVDMTIAEIVSSFMTKYLEE